MEETQRRFPVGSIIIGIVREHAPFGVFVDLNDPVAFGLIEIPEFRDEGRMTPEQYPPVGSTVRALVMAHTVQGERHRVWLTMRPSRMANSIP